MNGKRLVISLSAAVALSLGALPGSVLADQEAYFGAIPFEDHGFVCCGEAPATGGGVAYLSPDYEAGGSGHPWFGNIPFEDFGRIGPSGATAGAAASVPVASSTDGVVRSQVFSPDLG